MVELTICTVKPESAVFHGNAGSAPRLPNLSGRPASVERAVFPRRHTPAQSAPDGTLFALFSWQSSDHLQWRGEHGYSQERVSHHPVQRVSSPGGRYR